MNTIQYLPPEEDYIAFESEDHLIEKLAEWGFNKSTREQVQYKHYTNETVKIVGYQEYGVSDTFNTIIIEFNDGNLSCIHPAYLKEMQSNSFKKEVGFVDPDSSKADSDATPKTSTTSKPKPKGISDKKEEPKKETKKESNKEKTTKPSISLPEEKVHFSATIQEFATKYNPFTEDEDEIIILSDVKIHIENELEIGNAWCGHSKTLKKLELQEGAKLEFDGKIVAKKHNSEILYKINNPSKIVQL